MGVVVGGQYEANPVQILSSVRIQKIASGCDHFVALSYDGHIYTSGCGDHGQLGRVARYFASRGGRRGIGKALFGLVLLNPCPRFRWPL